MGEEKKCPLFRRPESLSIGKGIGYCDFDSSRRPVKEMSNFVRDLMPRDDTSRKNWKICIRKKVDAFPVWTFPILLSAYSPPKHNE
jgi:hypothetical protein